MKTIIVADDLTGANDTSAVLAKNGMRVATLDNPNDSLSYKNFDALAFHTESRGMESENAYNIVNEITKDLSNINIKVDFFSKRIDSTLRGNVGSEIDGILDALPSNTVAMVCPAFPGSNKIVIGDYMLVNGIPLENTDVRNDPTSPVTTSRVATVIAQQSKRQIGIVSMETILQGKEAIVSNIEGLVENGAQIIVFDSCTDEDINNVAQAIIKSNVPFITVDPGAFTNAVVMAMTPVDAVKTKQKALFVIGTASGIVVDQLTDLKAAHNPYIVKINSEELLYPGRAEMECQRVVTEILSNLNNNQLFVIATMVEAKDKLDLKLAAKNAEISVYEASKRICKYVSKMGYQIMVQSKNQIGGVYTSGGDITQEFLAQSKTKGVEIKDEIIPLTVYGRVIGGLLNHKPIVTKGGLIGDKKTLTLCADYLITKISNSFYEEGER